MQPWDDWPLVWHAGVFALAAAVLLVAGSRLARTADRLADRTGLGEAFVGAVLLGATTSLPGLVTSVVAAADGEPDLAVSNCLGGIAAQTAFLALADLTYRRANLEHAAASLPNLLQTLVLIAMLSTVVIASTGPDWSIAGVHPLSPVVVLVYLGGLRLTTRVRDAPMWRPLVTRETRVDEPDADHHRMSAAALWISFALLALVTAGTGWLVARSGIAVARTTELSGTFVGAFLTSIVTSLPELVTLLAAVRAGALTLAVADIIGGNAFDVLFVSAADVAHRDGSIYAAIASPTLFVLGLAILMASLLGAGLVAREREGIGFEGAAILVVYAAGFTVLLGV